MRVQRLELWSQAAAHKPGNIEHVVLVTGGIAETEKNIITSLSMEMIFFLIQATFWACSY